MDVALADQLIVEVEMPSVSYSMVVEINDTVSDTIRYEIEKTTANVIMVSLAISVQNVVVFVLVDALLQLVDFRVEVPMAGATSVDVPVDLISVSASPP